MGQMKRPVKVNTIHSPVIPSPTGKSPSAVQIEDNACLDFRTSVMPRILQAAPRKREVFMILTTGVILIEPFQILKAYQSEVQPQWHLEARCLGKVQERQCVDQLSLIAVSQQYVLRLTGDPELFIHLPSRTKQCNTILVELSKGLGARVRDINICFSLNISYEIRGIASHVLLMKARLLLSNFTDQQWMALFVNCGIFSYPETVDTDIQNVLADYLSRYGLGTVNIINLLNFPRVKEQWEYEEEEKRKCENWVKEGKAIRKQGKYFTKTDKEIMGVILTSHAVESTPLGKLHMDLLQPGRRISKRTVAVFVAVDSLTRFIITGDLVKMLLWEIGEVYWSI
uniref:BK_channel_a domain-containing protein n=1 Tax=Strongyloides papillosus TaxID=174720 RepID=A0A0N5BQ69_STREA